MRRCIGSGSGERFPFECFSHHVLTSELRKAQPVFEEPLALLHVLAVPMIYSPSGSKDKDLLPAVWPCFMTHLVIPPKKTGSLFFAYLG